jgi:hypothetical protein
VLRQPAGWILWKLGASRRCGVSGGGGNIVGVLFGGGVFFSQVREMGRERERALGGYQSMPVSPRVTAEPVIGDCLFVGVGYLHCVGYLHSVRTVEQAAGRFDINSSGGSSSSSSSTSFS